MEKEKPRIVYLGTPDFAVAPLRALVEEGYKVVGVVTMPDKQMGRHQSELQPSPVKQYAQSAGLPVLQPEKLKDPAFLDALKDWNADLQIVVAFRMLPEAVWAMPRLGTFNLHASLLPQYRGAAPINWAIINGEKETGVTTFFLTHEIDTGKVIMQERTPICETDNAGTLHGRLMQLGAGLVVKTVDAIAEGNIQPLAQEDMNVPPEELKPAPKIFKDTCRIDWNKPADAIFDFIRGLSPYPGAWAELVMPNGQSITLKVFDSEKIHKAHSLPAGTVVSDGKQYIDVAAAEGFVRLVTIQQAGKKRMTAEEFLNGNRQLMRFI